MVQEKSGKIYTDKCGPAESSLVAEVINRGNTSVAMCVSCPTEEALRVKLMHESRSVSLCKGQISVQAL